jgi:hypothetical protein
MTALRLTRRSLCGSCWFYEYDSHPHASYSADLDPCNFFLFLKMKLKLKGRRFDTIKEIQSVSQNVMKTLTQNDF